MIGLILLMGASLTLVGLVWKLTNSVFFTVVAIVLCCLVLAGAVSVLVGLYRVPASVRRVWTQLAKFHSFSNERFGSKDDYINGTARIGEEEFEVLFDKTTTEMASFENMP